MKFKPYPKYKPSDVEWLGDVPEGWQLLPLFTILQERQIKNEGNKVQNVLSLSYGRIIDRDVESNHGLLPESFETYQIVEQNDVILRLTDLQNDQRSLRVGQVRKRGIITSAYTCLVPSTRIEPSYAYLLLHAYDTQKIFYGLGGGVRQSMKFDDLKRLPLLLPSKDEQLALVEFLDRETAKIDTLIAKQEKLIELLKEKRQAVISHAVTKGLDPTVPMKPSGVEWLGDVPERWTVRSIRSLSNVVRGASPRPAGDPKYFGGSDVPWITVGEITKDESMFLTGTETMLTSEGASQSRLFRSGTLLLSNSGATLGVPKILRIDGCGNDGVVGFESLGEAVEIGFLYYFFTSITENLRDRIKQGAGQPNLNTDLVKEIKLGLPPLDEQRRIVQNISEQFAKMDELILKAERAIELQKEHRTALISAAVTGKIDVRDAESDLQEAA